jgi:hypothetical protein
MPPQEDYIEKHVAILVRLIAQIVTLRKARRYEEASAVMMQAQEKLFGCPASVFAVLPLADQLVLLAKGMSPKEAREKQVCYALLLREAGLSYMERDRKELAAGAFKTALHILLTASLDGSGRDGELIDLIRSMLANTPVDQVDAPLREMLEAMPS